ncbi:MAG: ABC transporter substrate-binding protein [Chloroflexi bacterium]|nr:ABC transporter substrate-binding protein [Chloroflexota bacterium]
MWNRVYAAFSTVLVPMMLLSCTSAVPITAPTETAVPTAQATRPAATPLGNPTPMKVQPTATVTANVKRGGQLKAALQNDWVAMDPLVNTATTTAQDNLYDPLIWWQPDGKGNWGPAPGLAASWETRPEDVVLKLQKGVKFHDGSDLNADVVMWNLDRYRNDPKSQQKTDLGCVAGAEKVDDYTLRVRLKTPCASLLAVLSQAGSRPAYPISRAAFDKLGAEQFDRNPVGTGPFAFGEWKTGDHVALKRWNGYWRKGADGKSLPYLDGVTFRLIVDDSVRLLEAKSGNIQVTELVQGKDIPSVKANPELVLVEGPWVGNNYRIAFNSRKGAFKDNLRLRQAILSAIDRDSISKVLGQGAGIPLRYSILPESLAYDDSVPYYWYDLNKAKQLVRDAGYPNGIEVTMDIVARQLDQKQAQMLKQMWEAIGVRTNLVASERAAWVSRVHDAGNFEFATMRNPSEADPALDMDKYLSGSSPSSYHKYVNPDFERCLVDANGSYDTLKRKEMYRRCQTMAYNDAFEGFVWAQTWNWLVRREVKGFASSWGEHWELAEVWLDK